MKKIITYVLILVLIVALSACGHSSVDTDPPPASTEYDTGDTNDEQLSDYVEEEEQTEPEGEGNLELVSLTLLGHDLTNSSSLEHHILMSPSGEEHAITVIADGSAYTSSPHWVFWETQVSTLHARLWDNVEGPLTTFLAARMMDDLSSLGSITGMGVQLTTHIPFHESADKQSAFVGFGTKIMEEALLFLYFAQTIPDSDYVLSMEFMFYLDLLSQEDIAILEELSQHLDFDLVAYLS